MDQKNDKKAGAPIPTLKDSLRPQLKIKGLQSGQSLIERLKQFKKKDLAFILAGLGVLFMAPLAEHFLMSPSDDSGSIKEGWGFKPGAGGLGQGGSPFESGLGGLAPGGAAGAGSDVITPLNVRDPSALVMGPGASQQPPAVASTPAPAASAPPPSSGSSDWKDALSQSAATAGKAAAAKASLPVPKVPLSNGGLRGLGVASGGGGGTFNVGAVPGAQFGKGGGGDSTGLARRTGDFKGAATRGSGSSNAGGFEQLKKQAGAQGSDISRAGSAISNLEQAAGRNMGSGTNGDGGAGAGGSSGADKASSASQDKGSKQIGESLEFLRLKQEQEKAIELKWEMIKKRAMFPLELQQEVMKTLIMGPVKAVSEVPGKMFGAIGAPGAGSDKYVCKTPAREFARTSITGSCTPSGDNQQLSYPCCADSGCGTIVAGPNLQYTGCELKTGAATETGNSQARGGVNSLDGQASEGQACDAAMAARANCGAGQSCRQVFTQEVGVYQLRCVPNQQAGAPTAAPAFVSGLNAACQAGTSAPGTLRLLDASGTIGSRLGGVQGFGMTEKYTTIDNRAKALAGALAILDKSLAAPNCAPTIAPAGGADLHVRARLKTANDEMVNGVRLMHDAANQINTAITKLGETVDPLVRVNPPAQAGGESTGGQIQGLFDTGKNKSEFANHVQSITGATSHADVTGALASADRSLTQAAPNHANTTGASGWVADGAPTPFGRAGTQLTAAGTDLTTAKGAVDANPAAADAALTAIAERVRPEDPAAAARVDALKQTFAQAAQLFNQVHAKYRERQHYMTHVLTDLGGQQSALLGEAVLLKSAKAWLTADTAPQGTIELRQKTVKKYVQDLNGLINSLPACAAGRPCALKQGESAQPGADETAWKTAGDNHKPFAQAYTDGRDNLGGRTSQVVNRTGERQGIGLVAGLGKATPENVRIENGQVTAEAIIAVPGTLPADLKEALVPVSAAQLENH